MLLKIVKRILICVKVNGREFQRYDHSIVVGLYVVLWSCRSGLLRRVDVFRGVRKQLFFFKFDPIHPRTFDTRGRWILRLTHTFRTSSSEQAALEKWKWNVCNIGCNYGGWFSNL
jgi:hypothetical protein